MKKLLSIAIVAAGTVAATAAFADGMPRGGSVKDSVAGPTCGSSAYNWNGAFAGVQVGTSEMQSNVGVNDFLGIGGQRQDSGWSIGGVVGYNFQKCNTVFGVEAEFNWVDNEAKWGLDVGNIVNALGGGGGGFPTNLFNAKSTMDFYGALKLRTGFAFDSLLLYVTGGIAFANIEHKGSNPAIALGGGGIPAGVISFNNSDTRWGWVVGTGTEYALTNRITWRSEVTYTRFEDQNFSLNLNGAALPIPGVPGGTLATLNAQDEVWRLTTGLNFKF